MSLFNLSSNYTSLFTLIINKNYGCLTKTSYIISKNFFIISRRLRNGNSRSWHPNIDKKASISSGTGIGGRLIDMSLLSHNAFAILSIALTDFSKLLFCFLLLGPLSKKSKYYNQ